MMGDFLTKEQILQLGDEARTRTKSIIPPSGVSNCAYCGAETKMHAYTDVTDRQTDRTWPACCSRTECLDKWEPLKS